MLHRNQGQIAQPLCLSLCVICWPAAEVMRWTGKKFLVDLSSFEERERERQGPEIIKRPQIRLIIILLLVNLDTCVLVSPSRIGRIWWHQSRGLGDKTGNPEVTRISSGAALLINFNDMIVLFAVVVVSYHFNLKRREREKEIKAPTVGEWNKKLRKKTKRIVLNKNSPRMVISSYWQTKT